MFFKWTKRTEENIYKTIKPCPFPVILFDSRGPLLGLKPGLFCHTPALFPSSPTLAGPLFLLPTTLFPLHFTKATPMVSRTWFEHNILIFPTNPDFPVTGPASTGDTFLQSPHDCNLHLFVQLTDGVSLPSSAVSYPRVEIGSVSTQDCIFHTWENRHPLISPQ